MPTLYNLGALRNPDFDGDQVALIDCLDWDNPRTFSHRALDELADAVARGLLARGLRRGDAVAILSENRAEFLAAYFGIMRAGLVAVPVNYKFPAHTVAFVFEDSRVRFAFADSARRDMVPPGIPAVVFGRDWDEFLAPGAFDAVTPGRGEPAMVLYTSGSTGRPKGVVLSHDSHLWAIRARIPGPRPLDQRLLVAAPLFHMNALGTSKFAMAAHASIVLMPQFNARRYVEAISRFRCTYLTSVPTMLVLACRERDLLSSTDLTSVRSIRMGSAPVTGTLLDEVRAAFPKAEISNVYGTTEAGPVVFGPHSDGRAVPVGALGWPRPGVEVKLVNESGDESDEGVLWQRTPARMNGYLNLPEKTREVLTEDGWYKSGDVFRRDSDGCYHFVGRADDMFVCGGENIYPVEVEQMLEKHHEIVQACVVAVPDEIKGAKPVAFVVLRDGSQLSEDEVKRYALANAPAYQHPRRVTFLSSLPLLGTNKVDRKALLSVALEAAGMVRPERMG
jgi:acyl-CoA synthetase (AMP-forming)/AMP-acid ligase II